MRVLMFGRGVIATIYGWALEQAGHEVEFFVRPGRPAEYGPTVELDLLDARRRRLGQRVTESWSVRFREQLDPDHDFDLIVLSVGHHRLASAVEFLAPRVGAATVLMFGNVWDEPADVVAPLPAGQVAWGFPMAGGGFDADGVLHGGLLKSVIFGTFGSALTEREIRTRELFSSAGITIAERPDFRGWLWAHVISDAGMHSQGLQLGSLSEMVGRSGRFRDALLAGRELLPLLRARGVVLGRGGTNVVHLRIPAVLLAPMMAFLTSHVALLGASLGAQTDRHAEEPPAIVRDVLLEARRLRVSTPRLDVAGAAVGL